MTPAYQTPEFRVRLLDAVEAWFDQYSDASDAGHSTVDHSALPALVGQLARAWRAIETGERELPRREQEEKT